MKRAKASCKRVKNYLGRVVRDIKKSTVELSERFKESLAQAEKLLLQKKTDKNKIYSIHASEVECISKGKVHNKYEFGVKAGFAVSTRSNWILGAVSLPENPYDGNTLEPTLNSMKKLIGELPKEAVCDLGYRTKEPLEIETKVHIVKRSRKGLSKAMRKFWNRRSAIEPIIGHMKSEHGLERNKLKGTKGDSLNVLMSAFGFNIKKLLGIFRELELEKLKKLFCHYFYFHIIINFFQKLENLFTKKSLLLTQ